MSFAITAIGVALAGIATSISLSVASAAQQKNAAKKQMQAQAMQAKVSADQRIKGIKRLAAQQKSSFLHSGISLTGEGTPDAVLSDTYDTGIEDVENIKRYGAVMGDNISANARARMLSTYGQAASDVSSYASSALSGAGKIGGSAGGSGGGGFFADETSLAGMGDSFGDVSSFAPQAPASFGSLNSTNLGI